MHDSTAMYLHMRMLSDPTIRRRILADTAMHRMMMAQVDAMPGEHREHMMRLMHAAPEPANPQATRSPAAAAKTKAPPPKTKAAPTKTKAAPTKTKAAPTKT